MLTKVVAHTSSAPSAHPRAVGSKAPLTRLSADSAGIAVAGNAKSNLTKSSRTTAIPKDGTATSGKAPKSKLSDLAPVLREPFNKRFVPLVRQYLGTLRPWQSVSIHELQQLHRKAFGDELSRQSPLEERDHCFRLIHYRMDDWHSKFASTATLSFEEVIKDLSASEDHGGPGGSDPDTSGPDQQSQAILKSTDDIGTYATWLLGDAKRAAPFYWRSWNGGVRQEGRLQSDLIVGTFAYHLGEVLAVPAKERVLEYPVGALTLATLGVQHALTHYSTGTWSPPEGRAGFFSEDNYGDTYNFEDGVEVKDRRLTRVFKVVENLSDEEWTAIYTAAYAIVKRRKVMKGRRGKNSRGVGGGDAAASGVAKAASDDDELMLAADG
ncbi:hypothetical protein BN946_scf184721.g6 [Trametes cinnabarina]|uniref:Uncharacterized protein n=1 Tax=Pycnoporus cinnabarinus TaxID=5643 RepID=A0A060SIA3_PYCCI|nr:hypothetical protein BN946_scf184721.g6 [Trametes cinnabarina]